MSSSAISILAENREGGIKKPTIKRVGSERDRILLEIPVKPNWVLLTFRSTQIIERLRCWVSFNLRTGMCRRIKRPYIVFEGDPHFDVQPNLRIAIG
jgi:hypothetical protein